MHADAIYSYAMVWRSTPICDTSSSSLSSFLRYFHADSGPVHPTPEGVPVMITAPRRRVEPCERKETMWAT